MNSENLRAIYQALCDSYHKVDDFRAKLLGFLPLAFGAAIFGLLDPGQDGLVTQNITEIGLLGALITFGLLIYELKGIQKCTGFIHYGSAIEKELLGDSNLTGIFSGLNKRERGWWFATEPVASAVIYSTVLAAWIYVASTYLHVINEKVVY